MKTANTRHPPAHARAREAEPPRSSGLTYGRVGKLARARAWAALCTACIVSGAPHRATAQTHKTDPYEVLDQIGHALKLVEDEYFEPADQGELLDGAIRGMLSELDPHSAYFNQSDLEIFQGSTAGKFGGIGVEVEFSDGDVIVIAPVEGSPADRAGIKPGDQIVALDGRPLQGEKPHELVRLMRGEIGTKLRLTIRNASDKQLRDVVVVREEIKVASVQTVLMTGNVAYFRIKAFQEGTHRELLQALGKLRKSSGAPSGILLDLRNNPGGLVREATALADEFLSSGTIYSTRHRGRILKETRAHSGGAYTEGPVVVLINEYSASAAELLAGALSDSGRARVVGARTFGKGSVQTILGLGHGGALKLTTALYYTPSGHTVQARGIIPHFAVDPGYIKGSALRALKESDLDGHVPSDSGSEDAEERGALPTNEELHLGVARNVPENPAASADVALRVGHRLVRGIVPQKADLGAAEATIEPGQNGQN